MPKSLLMLQRSWKKINSWNTMPSRNKNFHLFELINCFDNFDSNNIIWLLDWEIMIINRSQPIGFCLFKNKKLMKKQFKHLELLSILKILISWKLSNSLKATKSQKGLVFPHSWVSWKIFIIIVILKLTWRPRKK